jgi:pentatricopeptide repeat protein
MSSRFQIVPNEEHHTCMVAGFGYAGHFDEALSFIEVMPSLGCGFPLGWLALLGACRKWRNTQLGILCFDQIMQSDGGCATAYTLMADIYVASGMQADARIVEAMGSGSPSQREHRPPSFAHC